LPPPPENYEEKAIFFSVRFRLAVSAILADCVIKEVRAKPGARQPFIQFTGDGHDGRSGPSMGTAYRQAKHAFPSLYSADTAAKVLGDFFPAAEISLLLTQQSRLLCEQSRFLHLN
jgi:hypothetical protein